MVAHSGLATVLLCTVLDYKTSHTYCFRVVARQLLQAAG